MAACFQPRFDDSGTGVEPPSDLFAPDAGNPPPCMGSDPSPLSALHVRVRTSDLGGKYAPRNVGAIWVEGADGAFVKTIERWGKTRVKWLTRFVRATNNNVVDAVTSATATSHATHEVTWDLTDVSRCEVAAGAYQVVMEITDKNATGVSLVVPFTKDQTGATISPVETPQFHDLQFVLE